MPYDRSLRVITGRGVGLVAGARSLQSSSVVVGGVLWSASEPCGGDINGGGGTEAKRRLGNPRVVRRRARQKKGRRDNDDRDGVDEAVGRTVAIVVTWGTTKVRDGCRFIASASAVIILRVRVVVDDNLHSIFVHCKYPHN